MTFMKPRVLAIPGADPSHWKWARVSSRNWQNTAALFCAWSAVRRLSLVPAPAPEYMSSTPFTSYNSATMDRPLLDQRKVNGQEAQLLEGPSARLPAGWQFADLQRKPNECVGVSACDLLIVGKFPLNGVARNLVGATSSGAPFLGTLAPSPGHQWKREPQGAPGTWCRSYAIIWQLSGAVDFCPTSSLESHPHCWSPSAVWDDIGRDVLV